MLGLESGDILDDTWYHAAYVIEGTGPSDMEKLYLNGVLVDSRISTWNGINDDNYDVYIGYESINNPFHGIIDEVRIYDMALSDAAILDSYNPIRPKICVLGKITLRIARWHATFPKVYYITRSCFHGVISRSKVHCPQEQINI